MDHPLIEKENSDLRKRVIQLLQKAYRVPRSGNIVFVCGGNEDEHMRQKFRTYCEENLKDFDLFFPEWAMKDYFSSVNPEPFDISDFEFLVGELSHAIVIFPEAPGSFAETGYFSAISDLSSKTILALDAPRQRDDSFISMGPAKKISSSSRYQPNIQLDYLDPKFELIANRIRSRGQSKNKRLFKVDTFAQLTMYEIFCLVQKLISIMSISRIDDVLYIVNGIFRSKISKPKVRHIASILVGVGYIVPIGDYGHYSSAQGRDDLLEIRDGYTGQESSIRVELAEIYQRGDPEFLGIVEASRNAH